MANDNTFTGPLASSLVSPASQKVTLSSNYLNFHGTDGKNWSQQFLPELYAQEVERYGNRSVSSFLRMVGAEMPMASDQVIWSEQGRLHLAYKGTINCTNGAVTAIKDVDNESGSSIAHSVRVGATVVASIVGGAGTVVVKAKCTAVASDNLSLTLLPYGAENFDDLATLASGDTAVVIRFFVYGSEFVKGSDSMDQAVEPNFKSFTNRPIIIKDHFEVSGSDTAQIGWVEVSGESGMAGYLWYMKAEGDTRVRFEDYLEMSMIEAEKAATGSGTAASDVAVQGTEGLLSAIGTRGIVATNQFNASAELSEFDDLLKELDKQGAIEENMLFLNRDANLVIDDLLAGLNPGITGGVNFGVFENSADMALNLGFSGFRRGSYDFYKTSWKYLNDASLRGGSANFVNGDNIDGVLVPAGTSTVYDQLLGTNIRRPFLHVRYRASQADDRRMKSWLTGSVGGAFSSTLDAMEVNFLSERCLCVQARNNFVLFTA